MQFGAHPDMASPLAVKLEAIELTRRRREAKERAIAEKQEREAAEREVRQKFISERRARQEAKLHRLAELVAQGRAYRALFLVPAAGNGRRIIAETAARHGMRYRDLIAPRRTLREVQVRHEAMYLIARDTDYTLPQIGRLFQRDHTTIINGIRRHAELNQLPPARPGSTEWQRRRRLRRPAAAEDPNGRSTLA